jgi:carbamoyltransferase
MRILGVSGKYRNAAAALAVDGRVVAAVVEDSFARVPGIGYALTGGFPSGAAEACLSAAGIGASDLDEVAIVHDGDGLGDGIDAVACRTPAGVPVRVVEAVEADAVQAAASSGGRGPVLVWSADPPQMAAFVRDADGGVRVERIEDGRPLFSSAQSVARLLGLPASDPFGALDRLSVGGEPEYEQELAQAIGWGNESGVVVDEPKLASVVASIGAGHESALAVAPSWNEPVQRTRRALAASFTCHLAGLIRNAADRARERLGAEPVTFGGSLFANSRLNTELRRLMGAPIALAAVPEASGRALGAALVTAAGARAPFSGLALGPVFSDADIKRTLDNCRLDYVYEPDRPRIYARVSKLLAQGKIVAWFQGPMAFGPRSHGTRSILCDPSVRYARQNMNEYLRQVALDEPLPVVFAPSAARDCLDALTAESGAGVFDAPIAPAWREKLASALDWRHSVRVHASSAAQPDLAALVDEHYRRTGVPGLIETNLSGPGEPVACTPRDAVRTVYSSAIDALVISGFILMKDYWLLRAEHA